MSNNIGINIYECDLSRRGTGSAGRCDLDIEKVKHYSISTIYANTYLRKSNIEFV